MSAEQDTVLETRIPASAGIQTSLLPFPILSLVTIHAELYAICRPIEQKLNVSNPNIATEDQQKNGCNTLACVQLRQTIPSQTLS